MTPLLFLGCLGSATCTTNLARPLLCNANEVIGTDASGQPRCVPAPTGDIVVPACLTSLSSNGEKVYCTPQQSPPNQDVVTALAQLDGTVLSLTMILAAPAPAPVSRYVGSTTTLSYGQFTAGISVGVSAASRICANQFGADAHLCMMDELYQSAVDGTLGATSTIVPSWIYMPNWIMPAAYPAEPLQGQADNCGSYTNLIQSYHWRGVLVEWGALPDGTPGLRWHGGDDAPCSSQHPIACCR